jgi:hypothetical protein
MALSLCPCNSSHGHNFANVTEGTEGNESGKLVVVRQHPSVLTWSRDVCCSTDRSGARLGGSAVGMLCGDVRLSVTPFIPTANVVSRE